ncbi:DEAD/DEAH box helicase [Nocardioides sp. ChNu-99]|uniref:DEAD/DEAH box helicase n=1 Tax=Nocardioides sp. ChNu-99 TaxID=2839897 RepID=UPI002404A69A|nr:DEAD/DEAH box helicase [Nocardioides sp. ChNu-99]MDF9715903.1 DEAD/DEAH box helicase [Nocardioides sp. ChNu-99]
MSSHTPEHTAAASSTSENPTAEPVVTDPATESAPIESVETEAAAAAESEAPAADETTATTEAADVEVPEVAEADEATEIAEALAAAAEDAPSFPELRADLIAALAVQGITSPTPVQQAVIPDGLAGHDVLGRAQTGSGKTLAFGIPVMQRLAGKRSRPCHPRAVIIVPTRELATQVTRSMQPLAEAVGLKLTTVYGGVPYERQTRQLRQRADIVVATPGRLGDLLENGYCFFDDVEVTVLDEADHLCDLGFFPVVDELVGMTPAGTQRMLLSATLDGDVDTLVRHHLRDPRLHQLDPNAGAVTTMTHHTMVVGGFREKVDAAVDLVKANGRTIVFTRTREGAIELADALEQAGLPAVDLHGDLSQRVRERNLARFSSGDAQAVVATDVAARGIHVDGVKLVVHFDAASDPKAYLHRSGRTARAGDDGGVVTLTTPKFLSSVVRLQKGAAVEVRHHDFRKAQRPLTVKSLDESGEAAPQRTAGPRSEGGPRGGGSRSFGNRGGGQGGYRGNREGGGYQGNREGGAREGGYRGNREGGYQGNRPERSGEGGGYQGNREGGYRGNREGGAREGGYRGNREGGYQGNREGGAREGGYRGNREGGYQGNRPERSGEGGGYQGNREGGGYRGNRDGAPAGARSADRPERSERGPRNRDDAPQGAGRKKERWSKEQRFTR